MKRRICAAVLTALLLLCAAPLSPTARAFSDTEGHWAQADIDKARSYGLMEGYPDGRFGIGVNITRAEFVTILCRMFDWETVSPAAPSYIDCGTGQWYYAAVETARAHDVMDGAGAFRPLDYISREEMAVMLVRALGYGTLAGDLSALSLPFDDVTTNRGYIAVAYDLGLINGYDGGKFRPDEAATREQAAVILARLYGRYHATSYLAGDGYTPLRVDHPEASVETPVPTTPVEPFQDLYDTLKAWQAAGTDMSTVAVVLTDGGVATTTQGSRIVSTEEISRAEVEDYLERTNTKVYYAEGDQCAYLVSNANGRTVTVWYNDEAAMEAKLLLCRLFGVDHYILEDQD